MLIQADAGFLEDTIHRFKLSVRTYHKVIKVARTIADFQLQTDICKAYIIEALSYPGLEHLIIDKSRLFNNEMLTLSTFMK